VTILNTRSNGSKRSRAERRGIAAVEFALVVPLFIILAVGMVELGRAIMVKQVLTNAVREGAREAILQGSTHSQVKNLVKNYLTGSSIDGATVTVTPSPAEATWREPVTVSVSVPIKNVSWLVSSQFLPSEGEFRTSSTMLKDGE
jgi:Flp pilus assembly protein TadG